MIDILVPFLMSFIDKKIILERNIPFLELNRGWKMNNRKNIYGNIVHCESEIIDSGRSYANKNIYISRCSFSRFLLYVGDGGVIYVNVGDINVNSSELMFNNCSCSGTGGAMYFNSKEVVLKFICSFKCKASNSHFAYLGVSQSNFVDFLSISSCSDQENGNLCIFLKNGNQKFSSTNSTMNKANSDSSILFGYPASFSCSFCTISKNCVLDAVCVNFQASNGVMSFSNIIGNNSPSRYGVVHVSSGSTQKIHFCIFASNQNTLFDTYSNSLEVSHSFISHNERFSSRVAVLTANNNSFIAYDTYGLEYFGSYYCNVENPIDFHLPKITIPCYKFSFMFGIFLLPFIICFLI